MTDNLFQHGSFTSHSGLTLSWKIDCDALTGDDLDALAHMVVPHLPPFGAVYGIPRGGVEFARHLTPFVSDRSKLMLIVDDVLTTGASFVEARWTKFDAVGLVIFARGPCPDWVYPIFQLGEWMRVTRRCT